MAADTTAVREDREESEVKPIGSRINGDLRAPWRAPMQATTITGKMKGISINPTMKANDPITMSVEEMPRSSEARPNTEN
jgi:hypothetical protein